MKRGFSITRLRSPGWDGTRSLALGQSSFSEIEIDRLGVALSTISFTKKKKKKKTKKDWLD